ncbi:YnbE family lipoprotein [Pleionea sediminis]|uniref:YnbE family lipoprotein n=1 Tax=Pleionea sediminis TaxID=2569479 RepID=UPI001185BD03|nr:YnbE family lipoprotein [Pleionea sediminis]
MLKTTIALSTAVLLCACNPTIRLEGGDKPMEFNVNIKHEILIKVEKDVEDILSDDDLF